jgi:Terminase large subunit, T4likevirus-type, N-terminal
MDRLGGRLDTVHRRIVYRPLPSQRRFHGSRSRFKGFSGPIGSGKSAALCHEAIRMAYVNPGRTGLIGAPTYPMLRDATQVALVELLEVSRIPFEHRKSDGVIRLTDANSRILLRSMEEFERLRGTNLAWFGLDELTYTSEEAWLRLEGRLRDPKATRLGGFAVWTPKGYDWVHRKFMQGTAGYHVTLAKPFENRYILANTPDFYERLKDSYDKDFYEQEVLGQYLNVQGGQVYRMFSRETHLVKQEVQPGMKLLWALDFNVDPMCSVIAQQVGSKFHVLDEIVLRRASTLDACEEFSRRYPAHAAGLVIYGDASGQSQSTKGASDFDIIGDYFRNHGQLRCEYRIPKKNPAVRDRVGLMNAKLENVNGDIDLLVDPKCKELVLDFEQVTYREDSAEIDKMKDRRRTHMSDALGYLVWECCRPQLSGGYQGKRLF